MIRNFQLWKNNNDELYSLAKNMILHNRSERFNFIEDNQYNHIRDLLCFVLLRLNQVQNKEKFRIIDFGSNAATWANLSNKILMRDYDISIFDPTYDYANNETLKFDFPVKIFSEIDNLLLLDFDLSVFGSCIQYIEDFFDLIKKYNFLISDTILFTHTPLALGSTFTTNQHSSFTGKQIIYSFDDLITFFEQIGYECIYKSLLPNISSKVDRDDLSKVIYINLLFTKK